jgi:hypothetical protein
MMLQQSSETKSIEQLQFEAQKKLNAFEENKQKCDDYFRNNIAKASDIPNCTDIRYQISKAFSKTFQTSLGMQPIEWLAEYFSFTENQKIELGLNDSTKSLLQLFR